MKPGVLVWPCLSAMIVALFACAEPKTPQTLDTGADAGELTCDEKARAQSVCQAALRQRCDSQSNDCELGCEAQSQGNLPANTRKVPSARGDMETTQCRENCRHGHDACVVTVAQRCPVPCQ